MSHRKPIRNYQVPSLIRICRHCGTEFHPHRGIERQRSNWFCSQQCNGAARCRPALERFLNFVIPGRRPDDCWDWSGEVAKDGYARFRVDGKAHRASRSAWLLMYGPIPDGLFVLHDCDNGRCANPKHLRLGTQAENIHDSLQRKRRPTGEAHAWSKLTARQVRAIRHSTQSPSDLSRQYGVSPKQIRNIRARLRWRFLP